jgi:phenylacetic acid degradation operon negative regulatory protein
MLRKGLKRDILILLAALIDEVDAYSFKNQVRRMLFDGWYKKSTFGPTVSKLLSVGEIEKIEKNGKLFYRLTSKGSKKLKEDIPIFKLASQPWDGRWRIVIFDIKEEKRFLREALRDKLLSLGFGMWQKSVYIIPYNIEQEINQYLVSKKLFPSCVCLVARRADLGDDRVLANKVWQLDELNEEYENFIYECQELSKKTGGKGIKIKEFGKLWLWYKDLIFKDPHLPKQLLPENWLAEKAREEFTRCCSNMTRSAVVRAKREGGS